jgi:hypothetical protein
VLIIICYPGLKNNVKEQVTVLFNFKSETFATKICGDFYLDGESNIFSQINTNSRWRGDKLRRKGLKTDSLEG